MLDIASIHLALMSKAHEEPVFSNTNAPCSLDCIYLRYNDNVQGGHELLHLPKIHWSLDKQLLLYHLPQQS